MVDKETVEALVKKYAGRSDLFIVDIHVSPSNEIRILVDNERGIRLEECIELSRAIEHSLDRDENDFQLEVSSPGLSEPFKVLPQYRKNIGREVEIVTKGGRKHTGKLTAVTEKNVTIEEMVKIKGEKKRPEIKAVEKEFDFDQILSAKPVISYK